MSAVLGGTQSLHTNAYDEALGLPSESAAELALRTQQVIGHETAVPLVADPLGGSYYVESLTDRVEEEALAIMAEIDELGGAVKCIETGWTQRRIADSAYRFQTRVAAGERVARVVWCGARGRARASAGCAPARGAAGRAPAPPGTADRAPAPPPATLEEEPMPDYPAVIPMIAYEDGPKAMDWLSNAFGFKERMRMVTPEGRLSHGEMEAGEGLIMRATPSLGYEGPKEHCRGCAPAAELATGA